MRQRFERFSYMSMEARSRNVKLDGILSDIGPLFENEFTLDDEEDAKREIKTDLLSRTRLPRGVYIESVHIGNTKYERGTAEVDVTPLGLTKPVRIYVANEQSDYYTVVWDAITGHTQVLRGKQDETF